MITNPLRHKMNLAARLAEGNRNNYLALFLRQQLESLDRVAAGEGYLGATYYVPGELLVLFDVPVIYLERISGFAAANRLIDDIRLKGQQYRMPSCGCSYQILFECLLREKIIPPPMGFVAASYSCDDAWMYCRTSSIRYKVPLYLIDIAHGVKGMKSVVHIENQLFQLYKALSSKYRIARKLNEVVTASNEAMMIKRDIDELRVKYPGILDSVESFKLFTLYNDLGREYTPKILNSLYMSIKDKIQHYRPPGCPRLIWLGVIPLYRSSLIREIEKKYSCRIICEELFDFGNKFITDRDFWGDLSRRIVESIFFSSEQRTDAVMRFFRDMNADGVIHFSQRNCRFLPPMLPLLRRKLVAYGVPVVEVCGDVIYPDGFDEARCWDQLDAFFEQVHHKRISDVYRNGNSGKYRSPEA